MLFLMGMSAQMTWKCPDDALLKTIKWNSHTKEVKGPLRIVLVHHSNILSSAYGSWPWWVSQWQTVDILDLQRSEIYETLYWWSHLVKMLTTLHQRWNFCENARQGIFECTLCTILRRRKCISQVFEFGLENAFTATNQGLDTERPSRGLITICCAVALKWPE